MSRTVPLGSHVGVDVRLDVDRLVESRLLVQANSGAGKSWALRRLLEQTHGAVQQLVIDPEGEFATLREKFDYVLAGEGGDCAAEPRSAAMLARKLLELRVSAICNIYELRQRERVDFVERFVAALVNAPKHLWNPVLVVVDEAHVFCPERGKAASGEAIIDLTTRGRKRGMCAVLATQRLAKLRKDAAAELNNVLIGRTNLDVDIRRAAEALGYTTAHYRSRLRTLPPGHFYAFGPALEPDTVTRLKVGPVSTTHPTTGSRVAADPPPPTDRIRGLLHGLTDLPEAAEREAQSAEDLRAEVKRLESELALQSANPSPESDMRQQLEVRIRTAEAERDAAVQAMDEALSANETLRERLAGWQAYGTRLDAAVDAVQALRVQRPGDVAESVSVPTTPIEQAMGDDAPSYGPGGSVRMKPAQVVILRVLATLTAMRRPDVSKTTVAIMAGVSAKSSSYRNNLGALRTAGMLVYPSRGNVALTHRGCAYAPTVPKPETLGELRAAWIGLVSTNQAAILRELFKAWPKALDRDEVARATGASPKSSSYRNNLGRLRSLGLVTYLQFGRRPHLQAAEDLFRRDDE